MDTSVSILILAAGLGTRMKSRKAKVLHSAGGLTLIEHVTGTALKLAPAERITIVVGRQAEQVRAALGDHRVRFVEQTEQRGTGHAVQVCRNAAASEGSLLVLYGDVPLLSAGTLERLVEVRRQNGAAASVLTATLADPHGYGRIVRDAGGNVRAIVEQKAATPEQLMIREINSGIYCFDAALMWERIGDIRPDNPAREYYLTDIVEVFHRGGLLVAPLLHDDPRELLGINTKVELAAVDRIFRERTVERLMLAGVTIQKPETVTIDATVSIGADTVIEPFARILGATTIGEECRIGACSIVRNSEVGDRAVVHPFTIVDDSELAPESQAGPYARLRMGSSLGPRARAGNFVEMKKARLGAGSKSLHLAYLGDAVVGDEVNVGAGAITCNYDGQHKHETRVGDGAFIGSNATLVAPVEVGRGSYIGAGSVVTENVPEDALAVARARQENKPGWAGRRRVAPKP